MKYLALFILFLLLFAAVGVDYDLLGHKGCRYLKPVPHHPRSLACSEKP